MASERYYGTGRRKTSVARVYLVPGTGKITINKRDIEDYLGLEVLRMTVRQPLVATETSEKFDVCVNVLGGGMAGQAGAIRHGISRACLLYTSCLLGFSGDRDFRRDASPLHCLLAAHAAHTPGNRTRRGAYHRSGSSLCL